jgi:DNA-binding CsgD family transcriptional regulator
MAEHLRQVPGFCGARLLRRRDGDEVMFTSITYFARPNDRVPGGGCSRGCPGARRRSSRRRRDHPRSGDGRSQRRVEARTHLRSALEIFADLSAEPLVARAIQELRASGETARKRDPSTLLKLTPMERQVAQLVSQGMSNKEIAAQCWVSHRTVAFHLRNIFTKAGVTSRGELARLRLE